MKSTKIIVPWNTRIFQHTRKFPIKNYENLYLSFKSWLNVLFSIHKDIPTGADSCVTCLASDMSGRSLIIAGCGDGTVRLFDRRLAPTEW